MSAPIIVRATVQEDAGVSCMARVLGANGSAVTQATFTGITWAVYNMVTGAVIQATATLTVSAVIFDTLQTDARWTVDSTGYNFLHVVPATTLATGGVRARVEYKADPVSGEDFWIGWFELSVLPALSS